MAKETSTAFWARWREQRKKGPFAFIMRKALIYAVLALPVGYLYDWMRGKPINPDPFYHLLNLLALLLLLGVLGYIGWRFNEARFKGLDDEARRRGFSE
ncbi:hypothetical protein QU487_20720 [Crenobacter sp. SG2305]|uniref:hypothetical protein n=1 Tax=Crenobacter oryzisoli TaxID=3056844 RepID=UPI0025AB1CF7|nr:hypothetical protein [Crenobacter sp. SG2305]MDN0085135.1 hypothetical protein [Crenobacter sp. SG2305]